MDKTGRNGLRVGDIHLPDFKNKYQKLKEKHLRLLSLYDFEFDIESIEAEWWEGIELVKKIKPVNVVYYINEAIQAGKKVLAEGAQGSMLDIDFGTYPYVTSSNTICAAACTGLGIAPSAIGEVIGITKAYCTRVGAGPFPTELHNEIGEEIRKIGKEFGATTGRPRRCGWIDLPALRYTIFINGVTQLVMTKADVLDDIENIEICSTYNIDGKETGEYPFDATQVNIEANYKSYKGWSGTNGKSEYSSLPNELLDYISAVEAELKVPVTLISTGPGREELIDKNVVVA